jgi:hypothetical protein
MFPGFGISGYRTLTGDAQWIALDPAVTVFLGGNNSGKSNVLRLLHQHMHAIHASLTSDQQLATFTPRVDAPRDSGDLGLRVLWPIDVEGILAFERFQPVRPQLEAVLRMPHLNQCGFPSLPCESDSLAGVLGITVPAARKLAEQTSGQVNWNFLSGEMTGTRGGNDGEDTQRVLHQIRGWCIAPPQTEFVPPSRALRGGGADTGGWNFSGEGMVYQLHRLKSPQFDEDELRQRADALTSDLRVLLEDDRLEFGLPHDLSTVNLMLGGRWFPLESLGTGTEHAVVILAARHVYPERLLCLEEPDAHLHPRLQRRLIALLREATGRQVAIATHSAHMIDAADTVVSVKLEDLRSSVTAVGDHALFSALRALGYRASDILQTNCILWVEGPSDRIYLLRWLREVAPELIEGIDFSVVFYGGALLARLSASSELDDPTLVNLWRINRRMWLVMDSDRGQGELRPAVQRLQGEIAEAGIGGTWVTAGYTVENYVDADVLEAAVREVHPTVVRIAEKSSKVSPFINLVRDDGEPFRRVDKVGVALAVCAGGTDLDVLDLRNRVVEIADFIRDSRREPAISPPIVESPPVAE